jgi:hypothetical protein
MTLGRLRTQPARHWYGRVGLFGVALVAATYVAYVIAINVFLSTSLFDRVINTASPEQVQISYRRCWSIFPGRIHARDLRILGTDDQIEWTLDIDEIGFDLSLAGLTHRRFEVTRARASGVAFRLRQKLKRAPVSESEYVDLPPIGDRGPFGVRPMPIFDYADWLDRVWRYWTISMDDTIAEHVREIWIDHARFEGDARVAGRFYLKPIRAVDVGPIDAVVRRGRVLRGDTVIAEGLEGQLGVTIERFDPRIIIDFAHKLSVSTALRLRLPDLGAVPWKRPTDVGGRADVALLRLVLRHGVFDPGTHLAAALSGVNLARSATVAAQVTNRLWVRAELRGLSALGARADTAILRADAVGPELSRPLRDTHVVASVSDAAWSDGRISVRGDARAMASAVAFAPDDPLRMLTAELWADELVATAETAFTGKARIAVHGRAEVVDHQGVVEGTATTREISGAYHDLVMGAAVAVKARGQVAKGTVTLEKGTVQVENLSATRGGKPVLDVERVEARAERSGRRVELATRVAGARVRDVAPLNALWPPGTRVAVAAAPGATLAASGEVVAEGRIARGTVRLRAEGLGLSTAKLRAVGDLDAEARVSRLDLDAGTLAVEEATLTATGVRGNGFTVGNLQVSGRTPLLELARPRLRGADVTLAVTGGEVSDLRVLRPLEGGRATVAGKLALSSSERDGGGAFIVTAQRVAVTSGGAHLRGDLWARLAVAALHHDTAQLDLSGSRVELRNVSVSGAADTQRWRGDLFVQGGLLELDDSPRLDAQLAVAATDARPLLALFIHGVPGFVIDLIDLPDLRASALLGAGEGDLAVRWLDARGGATKVRGDYVKRGAHEEGEFTIDRTPFRFHMRVGDKKIDVNKLPRRR